MKRFSLALSIFISLHSTSSAQELVEEKFLSPKDLGFEKRLVTTKLKEGEVLVVTRIMELQSSRSWRSFVFYDASEPVSTSVLVADRSSLDEAQKGKWWFKINGSGTGLHDLEKLMSGYDGRNTLEYTFCPLGDREGFRSKVIVKTEIVSYNDVVARGAELPEMVIQGGWVFEFGNTFHKKGPRGWTQDIEWKPKEIEEAEKAEKRDSEFATLMGDD